MAEGVMVAVLISSRTRQTSVLGPSVSWVVNSGVWFWLNPPKGRRPVLPNPHFCTCCLLPSPPSESASAPSPALEGSGRFPDFLGAVFMCWLLCSHLGCDPLISLPLRTTVTQG